MTDNQSGVPYNKLEFLLKNSGGTTILNKVIGASNKTATVDGLADKNKSFIYINSNVTFNNATISLQLEKGSTATPYQPFAQQTQLLSLGNIELAKIGTYTDKIFHAVQGNSIYDNLDSTTKASLNVGSWYKYKAVEKIASYNGETITTTYMSTTGGLDTGATVYYGLTTPQFISL